MLTVSSYILNVVRSRYVRSSVTLAYGDMAIGDVWPRVGTLYSNSDGGQGGGTGVERERGGRLTAYLSSLQSMFGPMTVKYLRPCGGDAYGMSTITRR